MAATTLAPSAPLAEGQRKLSIETEPRTLYEDQLAEAQEAAIDIIQTKDPEEAMKIFTTPTQEVIANKPVDIRPIVDNALAQASLQGVTKEMQAQGPLKQPSAPF